MNGPRRRPVVWGHLPPLNAPHQREALEPDKDNETLEENGQINSQEAPEAEMINESIPEDITALHYKPPGYPKVPHCPPGSPSIPFIPPGEPDMPDDTCMQFAQAYIPIQPCNSPMYSPREALAKGTLFPDLYRPYPY